MAGLEKSHWHLQGVQAAQLAWVWAISVGCTATSPRESPQHAHRVSPFARPPYRNSGSPGHLYGRALLAPRLLVPITAGANQGQGIKGGQPGTRKMAPPRNRLIP